MNNTSSGNSKGIVLHAALVLFVLAGLMLILSAHTFAAASPDATAQVNAKGGANLRKSSTTTSRKVATLADNTSLTIYREVYKSKKSTSKKKIWYYVKASNGKKGYIRADLVDHVNYSMVSGTVKSTVNIRKGPGVKMKKTGSLKKGTKVTIYLDSRPVKSTRGRSKVWYRIYHNGRFSFVCSYSIKAGAAINTSSSGDPTQSQIDSVLNITSNAMSRMTAAQFENYLSNQGFPEAYKKSLRTLHAKHPNWVFVAYRTGLNWIDVMKKETAYGVSLVHKSYPASYRSTSKKSFSSYKMALAPEETDETVSEQNAAEQPAAPDTELRNEEPASDPAEVISEEDKVETAAASATEEAKTGDEDAAVVNTAAVFEDVRAALDDSVKAAEQGKTAEPLTGTVVPETINVLLDTKQDSAVIAELGKDSKVTVKGASLTTEQQDAARWYEVEFDKSLAVKADDTDAEGSAPVYAADDQSEDKELEAANEAAAEEIIGDEPDDEEENEPSENEPESDEAETTDGSNAAEVSQSLNSDPNVIRGYVRAEDIEVILASGSGDGTEESAPEEETGSAASAQNETTAPADDTEAETTAQAETSVPVEDAGAEEPESAEPSAEDDEFTLSELSVASSAKGAYYQVEPGWYNANANVVAYYLDPRNFLNEDRIYMFENLAYQSEYQTASVVNKILAGTKLPAYGFTANVFMNAGKTYNISPVFLAARVRQETGGNSPSVNGSRSGGTVVYNPFNIGAYGSNPAAQGLAYAKRMGWTTPAKAVNGGASYLASGYINKKQNTIYFQRFNVANGLSKAGTHQYMTNVMAPYSEAHITKTSYSKLGITNEPLGFVIPVYNNMPGKTKLP